MTDAGVFRLPIGCYDGAAMTETASCPHYPACSGCSAIGQSYGAQLETKLAQVRDQFARASLPIFSPNLLQRITPSSCSTGYRNRIRLVPRIPDATNRSDSVPKGSSRAHSDGVGIKLGLFRAGTHDVVDIPGCPVQADGINRAVEVLRDGIRECAIRMYDESNGSGELRFVSIRQGQATGEILFGLVTRTASDNGCQRLADLLMARCEGAVGVVQNVNPSVGNVIFGPNNQLLAGRDHIYEEVCGVRLRLGLTSFFQVNTNIAGKAYDAIVRHLHLDRRNTLFDLYAGVGAIGLVAAGSVHRVVGIEEVEEAVEFAESAAIDNAISNVEFRKGDVGRVLPDVVRELGRSGVVRSRTSVVVNPPRKGLDKDVVNLLIRVGAERIAYLSCNPTSLLRDVGRLMTGGYRIQQTELFDMFPQTDKVETLVVLKRLVKK